MGNFPAKRTDTLQFHEHGRAGVVARLRAATLATGSGGVKVMVMVMVMVMRRDDGARES